MTWDLLSRSVTHGIVPGLVGGPWDWQRWAPASPWATPPMLVMVLGWLALGAVLAVSLIRKRAHLAGVAGGRRLRDGVPDSDLPDALVAVHRTRTGADTALSAGPGCRPRTAGRGRILCAEPAIVAVARRLARACSGNGLRRSGIRRQQPLLDRHVPDDLAGQPRAAVSAERACWAGRGPGRLRRADAGSGGRPVDTCSGWRTRRTWPATCSRCCGSDPSSPAPQANCGCSTPAGVSSTPRSPGYARSSGPGAAVRPLRPAGCSGSHSARRSAAAGRLDRGDQLPGQQRRLLDAVADGGTARRRCRCSPGSIVSTCDCRAPATRSIVRANTEALAVCIASGPVGFVAPR